jgi:cytochrome c peroxidase
VSGSDNKARRRTLVAGSLLFGVVIGAVAWFLVPDKPGAWTDADRAMIASLSLASLPPLPADATNAVADDPLAAELGHRLFFDARLSINGQVSCSTCHQPEKRFTDGLTRAVAVGLARRNTPSIIGTAYSPWQYWDGRRDSQWAQALSPIEDPAEHGSNRMQVIRLVGEDPDYRASYEKLFGPLPDFSDQMRFPLAAAPVPGTELETAWMAMSFDDRQTVNRVYANIGKTIAAYERLLQPGASRFDRYANAVAAGDIDASELSEQEVLGLQLFIGEARCTECHNGPLLTNNEFHNTGVLSAPGVVPDRGRLDGVEQVRTNEFNCLGAHSDAAERDCAELRFVRSGPDLVGAMRTPSLRNLGGTEPYFHKGQAADLAAVLEHYNQAPLAMIGHNEAEPLGLSKRELQALEAFLVSLDAPPTAAVRWLNSPR